MSRGAAEESGATSGRTELSTRAVLALALMVAVLEQVGRSLPAQWPRRHLDISWMMGLEMARDQDLRYGSDLVFTYGPWGFLSSPTGIDFATQIASTCLRLLAVGLLFIALTRALPRRSWSVVVAAGLALLISNGGQPDWILMLALTVWALTCLTRGSHPPLWTLTLAGSVAAFLSQVKLTPGLLAVGLVGLMALTHGKRMTALASGVAGFVVTFVALWLLAGQSLADVPRWFHLGVEIVVGYSDSMAYYDANVLMLAMVLFLGVAALVALTVRQVPWVARAAVLIVLLFFAKLSLSLPDGGHLLPGYAGVTAVLAVLLGLRLAGPARVTAWVTVGMLCWLLSIGSPVIPARHLSLDGGGPVGWGEARVERLATARVELQDDLAVSPEVLAALEGYPVSADPWEISAIWAYGLQWQPLIVPQQYSSYTPKLDEESALSLLIDPDHRVLRERVANSGSNPLWVTPAYTLALTCHFEVVASDGEWSALARVEDRCAAERSISTSRVAAGETVSIPRATNALVAVRFVPDPRTLTDRLLSITGVQKHLLRATVDDTLYRVSEALADGPLIVGSSAPEPVLFDTPSASEISFDRAGEIEFVEIPLRGREAE